MPYLRYLLPQYFTMVIIKPDFEHNIIHVDPKVARLILKSLK